MFITQTNIIEVRWEIEGVPGYGFGSDKKLYNLKTSRNVKMTVKGYTKGFQIKKRFLTLNKLRPLLIRPVNFDVPF